MEFPVFEIFKCVAVHNFTAELMAPHKIFKHVGIRLYGNGIDHTYHYHKEDVGNTFDWRSETSNLEMSKTENEELNVLFTNIGISFHSNWILVTKFMKIYLHFLTYLTHELPLSRAARYQKTQRCHSGSLPAGRQVLKPESSAFNMFWIPAFAGMTHNMSLEAATD